MKETAAAEIIAVMRSEPPKDCPFEQSPSFNRLAILSRHKWYGNSDTWYPSWASDDVLYSGNYANCFGFGLKANLPDSRYGMLWQEIRFLRPDEIVNDNCDGAH